MSESASRLTTAALAYAARGLFVFPLKPKTKQPLAGSRGFLDASADLETVRVAWAEDPQRNIGLYPGRSDLLILDLDGPSGHEAAVALGLLECGTLQVVTGRPEGGRHLYFRRPPFAVGNGALAPGVDVRCDDGYVVSPPSVHPTGAVYRWLGRWSNLADLPQRALDALRAVQARDASPADIRGPVTLPNDASLDRRIEAYLGRVGQVTEGQRNAAAFQVGAWLVRDMALDVERASTWLASWNAGNLPPLGVRELRACLRSATTHGRRPRGAGLERRRDPFAGRHREVTSL